MRRTGWGGELPADDDEARARIIEACRTAIADSEHPQLSLSEVARRLSVTRQTVYRYFPSTEALLTAVAIDAGRRMYDMLLNVRQIDDPAGVVVELAVIGAEIIRDDRVVGFLLGEGTITGVFTGSITDETSVAFAVNLLENCGVDWRAIGLGDDDVSELAEWALHVMDAIARSRGERRGELELRDYLNRWMRPGVERVIAAASGPRRRRRSVRVS
ncbi:TetR/AcrR family transcriptional regulator [Gordonia sp. (in: high G+C Gram-positive bacteria)]|uniref:TetR/AcrR family transcriptional regulator n=1 Tax=Gordonia sp. (in: high G+C Gram-positive bacteria) TaxID=84139 RepID=UPI001DF47916|nr:TetR/AcrR family transcriptional regulator [Gordonia sp. (in: high G+C Gram-positive bacteria)]MCB1296537.1 TetR/AcrR family transcriptional regulator [Gordonia sp. (in: high G+C Gram-positive bacteria)]HMS75521.1 TetR/AcrR family transcriptional regulator [Gordonia sp. (in: high G+C Gram-positive bacteria)]HQV18044.1 TetR/AcrR family transcriptional regulator [Gordonia sp. (in: high G+C Gram-positive bacteria)]